MEKEELIEELRKSRIKQEVLRAIETVDRRDFIPAEYQKEAYENHPIQIGRGQTISQPYTVAFMLSELELKEGNKVLEIGTGSGWNAALISCLIGKKGKLYTAEIVKELAESASKKLKHLKNVKVFHKDASDGLRQYAPFDRIILTAAPSELSEKLKGQLKDKGILLAPVGRQGESQRMLKIKREGDNFKTKDLGAFVFVPIVRKR